MYIDTEEVYKNKAIQQKQTKMTYMDHRLPFCLSHIKHAIRIVAQIVLPRLSI